MSIFSAISWVSNIAMTWWSALYKINMLSWIFIVLVHWNNSSRDRQTCHSILIHYLDSELISLWWWMLSGEAANINLIVFSMTQPDLKTRCTPHFMWACFNIDISPFAWIYTLHYHWDFTITLRIASLV